MRVIDRKVFFGIGVLSLLINATISAAFADVQKIGVVGAANQTLSAISETNEIRSLALGKDIFFNDTLNTDASGNAQIMFVDKSALTIGPNSAVVIDKFVYNPSDGGGELTMRGTKGAFRFIGGALSKKQDVKFKTPVGTIGIRGGIVTVTIAQNGATSLRMDYGIEASLTNKNGIKQAITPGLMTSLATPTSQPTAPVQFNTAVIASEKAILISSSNDHGGATNVPTSKDMDAKSSIIGEGKAFDGKGGAPGTEGDKSKGDSKDGPAKKDGSKSGTTDGQGGDKNKQEGTNNTAPTNSADGGHATADGGYVDGKGVYHTPAEVAANKAVNADSGNNQGTNSANTANNGSSTTGVKNPGTLTSDGGYVDSNGVQHSAAELATFRKAEANNTSSTSANNNTGSAVVQGGGYNTTAVVNKPATALNNYNTYNSVGNYGSATGGYIAPGGYYVAPTAANGYIAPGTTGYMAPGTSTYIAPATVNTTTAVTSATTAVYNNNTATSTTTTAAIDYTALQTKENTAATTNFSGQSATDNLSSRASFASTTTKFTTQDASLPGSLSSFSPTISIADRNARRQNCSSCSYVGWDAWGQVVSGQATNIQESNVLERIVPYVYGQINTTLPSNINADYSGPATYSTTSGLVNGTMNAHISRTGGGTATVSTMSFSGVPGAGTLSSTGATNISSGTFSGVGLSGGGYSGAAKGAIFGPGGATAGGGSINIGGSMTYGTGTATAGAGAGVFLGGCTGGSC